ncbi:response regulator [Phototrophicus methaneseepsis]|uniref:Response regulator n=1 Tax=Phototrophicus methaneseepsis TaxID=2710758 RepID=A0A7S8E6T0_9CHLR|nr:response regulator [Phototrophicus methaneseepsis]QPC81414.1 response regulator [Phototrophicus methaneseepsis]
MTDRIDGWHVLLVEDEFDSLQMVTKILLHHGAEVRVARDGYECLIVLESYQPTLVIMDLAMPQMDGWETLSRIRARSDLAHLPVVAITAYHSVSVEQDAYDAGFDAYLSKPLETNNLIDQLMSVIEKHRAD